MTKEEEIRMINEKLDFYVMEASDEEFNTEEVRKLVKRLDELDPIPLPWTIVNCRRAKQHWICFVALQCQMTKNLKTGCSLS